MSTPGLVVRLVAVAIALTLAACCADKPVEPPRPALVIQPVGGDAGLQTFSGEVHAREEPQLAFRIGGKIVRRLVDAGARVKAGQALAELDASDVDLQNEAARAQLASAQSELELARAELDRYRSLLDRQLVSRSFYDARQASFRAAQAGVRQAQAQARVTGNQAGYAVLRAPKEGVIAQRLAEAGQVVAAGQAVFVLAADGGREVAISIPEQSVAQYRVGRDLLVELWSAPGKRYPGKLREIAPAADALTRTYAARVSFAGDGESIELGQSARVFAQAGQRAHLRVPLSAVIQGKGRSAVWVVDPATSKVHLKPVQAGPYEEDGVPVLAGLQAGDWVVSTGAHLLLEGETVAPIDRDNRPVVLGAHAAERNPGAAH